MDDPQHEPGHDAAPPRNPRGAVPRAARRAVARVRTAARWGTTGRAGLGWRLMVPLVFAMAGFLFVTSAGASDGFDLRPQREAGLAELVQDERRQVDRLRARAGAIEDDVNALTRQVGQSATGGLQSRAERLRGPAGMLPVSGPGLKVTLEDAPAGQPVPEGYDANAMVVHQQDLQAVVNALWAGGAEGITLQGQRLISTTGIKCVGNTVVLHGVPYSPPYEIVAVGDPVGLQSGLDASEYVQTYLEFTKPPVNIGWDVELLTDVQIPGYQDSVDLEYAQAAGRSGDARPAAS